MRQAYELFVGLRYTRAKTGRFPTDAEIEDLLP